MAFLSAREASNSKLQMLTLLNYLPSHYHVEPNKLHYINEHLIKSMSGLRIFLFFSEKINLQVDGQKNFRRGAKVTIFPFFLKPDTVSCNI